MTEQLTVDLFGQPIGTLAVPGSSPYPEDWTFSYGSDYLASKVPLPLSVALPLRPEPYVGAVVRNWFCNLLPEGAVREAVVTRMRIPARDDFALLAAIGGECAGAVSIRDRETPRVDRRDDETDLETLLRQQGEELGDGAWALLGTPLRLSLAGAQDKIAVIAEPGERLRLPAPGESSTHILKPDSSKFRGLRDLEALGLALARAVGLNAVRARPIGFANRAALLIERYDRQPGAAAVRRLHQEDFCQALGYPAELKYESQGGPGLAACSTLIRRLGLGPVAVQALLDWVVFNALMGNADAHGKNLALLMDPAGQFQLAPFYDLVPTLVLPERLVDRTPALRIGAARRIDEIRADDWRQFAREAGYAPNFVLKRVAEIGRSILDRLQTTGAALIEQGCDASRMHQAANIIRSNVERIRDVR
ncbi:MAG TPA: type II toxin-antitoxin system HipA family toxin [Rudaea sp.]|jgi:serine/threonine-protein kinase HipA